MKLFRGKNILFIAFLIISAILFKYFSYWGLGASILLLFSVVIIVLVSTFLSFVLYHGKEIVRNSKLVSRQIEKNKNWKNFIKSLKTKYPKLYHFIINRFKKNNVFGLYLTNGILISSIFFFLFLSIIQDYLFKDPLILADIRIIYLTQDIISEASNNFFALLTTIGDPLYITLFSCVFIFYFIAFKKFREAKYFSATILAGLIISYFSKIILQRPRPELLNLISRPNSYSLPSGHALLAVCFFGMLGYFLFKYFRKKYLKIISICLALSIIILIGLSRIYLGVHYLSDVLAGWYLGFSIISLTITFLEVKNKFYPTKKIEKIEYKNTKYGILIFFALLSISITFISYRKLTPVKPPIITQRTTINHFLKNDSLFSEDLFGNKMEPINFIIIGSQQKIEEIFKQAQWFKANPPTLSNAIKTTSAMAKNAQYPSAPVTPSFYANKPNDMGFEKATEKNSVRQRHHTRYWKTGYQINNQDLWVATASFDQKVEISPTLRLLTHQIDPDIDLEREYIINDLKSTTLISEYQKIKIVDKFKGKNAGGDPFFTDGYAYLIYLQ